MHHMHTPLLPGQRYTSCTHRKVQLMMGRRGPKKEVPGQLAVITTSTSKTRRQTGVETLMTLSVDWEFKAEYGL